MDSLAWSDGTSATADGRDLPAVLRGLTRPELDFWERRLRGACYHEHRLVLAEIDRRDPWRKAGTLWQHLADAELGGNANGSQEQA